MILIKNQEGNQMKKTVSISAILLLIFVLSLNLEAVVPKRWELRTRDDFLKGKFFGLSLSSSGVISIGPRVEKWELPAEEFYLSLVMAPNGVIFLGTGHGGKIYRIGNDRKAELYYQAAEMDVTALALDAKGQLYAATSPNGKIYRITAKGKGEELFDPQEKYIWDLVFSDRGSLLAAVGESGGIYEINPSGEGRLIFKAKTNHILCLKKLPSGDFLAGSGGRGLLYRVSASGKPSVIFESGYEEIRSLDIDREGNIYITASGQVQKSSGTSSASSTSSGSSDKSDTEVAVVVSSISVIGEDLLLPQVETSSSSSSGKSATAARGAIFQVSSEGLARKLWSSDGDIPYELFYEPESKRVIFSTGPGGRIYAVDREGAVELLTQETSEQIFRLINYAGKIHVVGNNPCFLGVLPLTQNLTGEYLSPVLDAGVLASWGKVAWEVEAAPGSTVQVQSRSGNTSEPDETWSDWSPPYSKPEEKILSPKARYLQLKVSMKAQSGQKFPRLTRLMVFYLQANVAPVIEKLDILPPNQVYLKPLEQDEVILGLDQVSQEKNIQKEKDIFISPKKSLKQGFRTFTWEASDSNGDQLSYNVYIRKENENSWRLLQDKINEKLLSFDTRNFSDGTYFIKLEATDLPSNPPGSEMKVEKISQPFVIDNSSPMVKNFQARRNGDSLEISFEAEDNYSYVEEVRFMIRPGDWRVVFPVDGICDSRTESFRFSIKLPSNSDNLILIRVRDSFGNLGTFQSQF